LKLTSSSTRNVSSAQSAYAAATFFCRVWPGGNGRKERREEDRSKKVGR
jgi:hypothetical protein